MFLPMTVGFYCHVCYPGKQFLCISIIKYIGESDKLFPDLLNNGATFSSAVVWNKNGIESYWTIVLLLYLRLLTKMDISVL